MLSLNRLSGPPTRQPKATRPSPESAPQAAQENKESSFGWAKAALGLGLAAGTLAGCTDPVPPAADAGAYSFENPEVVVLSDSIQRVDLSREQTRECTGFGEDEDCSWEDVAYHPIGLGQLDQHHGR